MKLFKSFIAAGLVTLSAAAAAVPVTLNVVNAEWSGWTGGTNVSRFDSDGNGSKDTLTWGGTHAKSGYRFKDAGNLPATFDAGDAFVLGKFTHYNSQIPENSAITGASLAVSTELAIQGSNVTDGPYTFNFAHNETLNVGKVCWWIFCWMGDKPVDDIVLLDTAIHSNEFTVGSNIFSMEILGFGNLHSQTDKLFTEECDTTSANIIARLNVREIPQVPEPATLALLGIGLLGVGLLRRRKPA